MSSASCLVALAGEKRKKWTPTGVRQSKGSLPSFLPCCLFVSANHDDDDDEHDDEHDEESMHFSHLCAERFAAAAVAHGSRRARTQRHLSPERPTNATIHPFASLGRISSSSSSNLI